MHNLGLAIAKVAACTPKDQLRQYRRIKKRGDVARHAAFSNNCDSEDDNCETKFTDACLVHAVIANGPRITKWPTRHRYAALELHGNLLTHHPPFPVFMNDLVTAALTPRWLREPQCCLENFKLTTPQPKVSDLIAKFEIATQTPRLSTPTAMRSTEPQCVTKISKVRDVIAKFELPSIAHDRAPLQTGSRCHSPGSRSVTSTTPHTPIDMVAHIKWLQQHSRIINAQWHKFCDEYGQGCYDPCRYQPEFLTCFLRAIAQ